MKRIKSTEIVRSFVMKHYSEFQSINEMLIDDDISIVDGKIIDTKKAPWDFVVRHKDHLLQEWIVLHRKDVTFDILKKFVTPSGFKWISDNPNITVQNIKDNPHMEWNYGVLIAMNPNITWDDALRLSDKCCPTGFAFNPNFKWEIAEKNVNLRWSIYKYAENKEITWDIVKSSGEYVKWSECYVSMNPNITWEIIQNNPTFGWDYASFTKNPNFKREYFSENPDLPWKYHRISGNLKILIDDIDNNLDKSWCWDDISARSDVNWDVVFNYKNIPWVDEELARNLNFTCYEIYEKVVPLLRKRGSLKYPSEYLVSLSNLDHIFIKKDINWCPEISKNESLTWDMIINNTHINWDMESLARMHFKRVPNWNYGEGWHFVPELENLKIRSEIMFLHHIIERYNLDDFNVKKNLYIPNEIYHMIIEMLLV